jgi:hypothetical protein
MTPSLNVLLCTIMLTGASLQAGEPKPSQAKAPEKASAPVETPKPASPWPGQWLADSFGPEGLEALKAHGYIILQGRPGTYRLQTVVWKSLEALVRSTKNVQQFSETFQRLKAGQSLAPAGPLPFLALGDLPPESLMTPPLHALLEAMAAYHSEWTALAGAQDEAAAGPALPALAGPALFDTAWGKAFAARTRADILADPAPLAELYFGSVLAGVRADAQAAAHFTGYMKDRAHADVSARLAADAHAGAASPQLRADLARYLTDQRRFHALARIRREAAELEKKTSLPRDLRALETVAAVLRTRPGLLAELEGVVQAAPPAAAAPELASAGLHLEKPLKLGQHELGDAVTLSGAYWVDGLPAKEQVEFEETTYRDTPAGLRDAETRTVKRGNGGPYAFSRRLVLEDSTPFTFRSVISAPSGNPLSDSVAVPVAKDFELALLKLAAADAKSSACAFPDAAAAYAKLEESLADAAGAKAQYHDLLDTVRKRRAAASGDAAVLAKLEAAVKDSAPEASPEACRYDLKRTEAAMALARSLPPGCDRTLTVLRRQHVFIARRVADQQAFAADARQAAAHRRSCAFGLAAEELSRGLAILEADPEADCGQTAESAKPARADLQAVRADELWRAAFTEDISAAQAEKTPAQRLAKLHPLIARIGSLHNPACFSGPLSQAEKLAQAAGADLVMPDALASQLGPDEGATTVVAEVAAQRRKLLSQAEVLETKQKAEQSPTSPVPQAKPAAAPEKKVSPVPATKAPKQKTKAKKQVKTEASQ